MTPDLKWSEIVVIDNGSEVLEAPPIYCSRVEGYERTIYRSIAKVFYLEPSEFDSLDPSVHVDAASGLKKFLFTLGVGIDFYVSFFVTEYEYEGVTKQSVSAAGCFKYEGNYNFGIIVDNFYVCTSFGGFAVGAGGLQFNPINMLQQYGAKFYLSTPYDTYNAVVEGVTQAGGLTIDGLIPGYNTGFASGFQSWDHIHDDETYFMELIGVDRSTWVSNPQYFYYGYDATAVSTRGSVFSVGNLDGLYAALKTTFTNALPNPFKSKDLNDPTQDDDPSTPGGGGGNQDKGSDPIDFPGLPTGGPLATGAIKAYEVTQTVVKALFLELWNASAFDLTTFQKLVNEPMDALISLHCVPIDPTNGNTENIYLGNYQTAESAPVINKQYYTVDCGTLTLTEYWGSALDYSPYSSLQIFLPFIGIRDLDIDECMNEKIQVKYNYDILTGNLAAQIKVGKSVLYKFPGNVKQNVPVTSYVNTELQKTIEGAGGLIASAISGGVGAEIAGISAAVNVALSKTKIIRTGDLQGSTGLLDDFNCYLIIHRPIQSLADNFKGFKGYPSNLTRKLSALKGYTEVEYIHLTGIDGATDTELAEIERLLKSGVII